MYWLTDDKKNVSCNGLNFSVKPTLTEYSEFLLPFELLFYNIKREDVCNEDISSIKATQLDIAYTSQKSFSSDQDTSENVAPLKCLSES